MTTMAKIIQTEMRMERTTKRFAIYKGDQESQGQIYYMPLEHFENLGKPVVIKLKTEAVQ